MDSPVDLILDNDYCVLNDQLLSNLAGLNKILNILDTSHDPNEHYNKITSLENECQVLQSEATTSKEECRELKKERDNDKQLIKQLEDTLASLTLKYQLLESTCTQHEHTIQEKDEHATVQEEQLSTVNTQLIDMEERQNNLNSTITELEDRIHVLTQQHQLEKDDWNMKLEDLRQVVTMKDEVEKDYIRKMLSLEDTVSTLEHQQHQRDLQIESLLDERRKEAKMAADQIAEQDEKIEEMSHEIEEMRLLLEEKDELIKICSPDGIEKPSNMTEQDISLKYSSLSLNKSDMTLMKREWMRCQDKLEEKTRQNQDLNEICKRLNQQCDILRESKASMRVESEERYSQMKRYMDQIQILKNQDLHT
ncbi:hypothetical protein BDB01DRAFT_780196 [Pilobolus umbonatus]|nr:hypothetical protein BDB01DRAFT_780196 [Pilobolus umbonatus]